MVCIAGSPTHTGGQWVYGFRRLLPSCRSGVRTAEDFARSVVYWAFFGNIADIVTHGFHVVIDFARRRRRRLRLHLLTGGSVAEDAGRPTIVTQPLNGRYVVDFTLSTIVPPFMPDFVPSSSVYVRFCPIGLHPVVFQITIADFVPDGGPNVWLVGMTSPLLFSLSRGCIGFLASVCCRRRWPTLDWSVADFVPSSPTHAGRSMGIG